MTAVTAESLAWQALAACADEDPDLFFIEGDLTAPANIAQAAEAKAVCSSCPVSLQCAEYAADVAFGIWAGKTEAERQAGQRRYFQSRRTA
jgi:WhiB family redox-sensing transcriptional regulator